jgi:hypothetical protein
VDEPVIKLKLPANEPQRTHTRVEVEKTGSDEWTITVTATYADGTSAVTGVVKTGADDTVAALVGLAQDALDRFYRFRRTTNRALLDGREYLVVSCEAGSEECSFATPEEILEAIRLDHQADLPILAMNVSKVVTEPVHHFASNPRTGMCYANTTFTPALVPVKITKVFNENGGLAGVRGTVGRKLEFETKIKEAETR